MADSGEFVPFRFKVSLYHSDSNELLCAGYFSEVTGFEITMEPKTIREGCRNWGDHQSAGPTKFAPMTLKRGVTSVNDLWSWFDITTRQNFYGYRLHGEISVRNGRVEQGNFPDYRMVGLASTPRIEVHIVESGLEHLGGVGEPGTPPLAPAVANAVFAACGKRLRELPLRV